MPTTILPRTGVRCDYCFPPHPPARPVPDDALLIPAPVDDGGPNSVVTIEQGTTMVALCFKHAAMWGDEALAVAQQVTDQGQGAAA